MRLWKFTRCSKHGPSVASALPDPVLELHGPEGFQTITNSNWMDTQAAEIQATGIAPTDNLESAILATLNPEHAHEAGVGRNIDSCCIDRCGTRCSRREPRMDANEHQ